jgi:DNA-binding transcriptional LysR family regulator
VFTADDFLVQLRAAEAGVGAVWLGRVAHRFTERALVELHGDWPTPLSELHLVASRAALAIPRVRAVADLLVAELRGVKALPRGKAR